MAAHSSTGDPQRFGANCKVSNKDYTVKGWLKMIIDTVKEAFYM